MQSTTAPPGHGPPVPQPAESPPKPARDPFGDTTIAMITAFIRERSKAD
jgi:hypothetical protein